MSGSDRGDDRGVDKSEGRILYLFLRASLNRYAVPVGKSVKVIPVYAVLTSRESESNQIALFNPSQYGYLTHPAVSGYSTGSEEFWIWCFE